MTLSFIGSWGERFETSNESAERMQKSWGDFPASDDEYGPWSLRSFPDDVLRLIPVPADDLDAIAEAARVVTERINEGPRTAPGFHLEFARERVDAPVVPAGGPLFSYDVRCGFAGPRALRNHLHFELDPTVGNSPDEQRVVRDHLVALVRAWQPEYVSACTYAFHKAQGHRTPRQVRVGWMTHIRDDVPLDVVDVPDDVRIEVGDGGRYLTLAGTPRDPSLEQALAIRRALGY
ncbi:hypothetical protein [Mycolicibacterium sediminis]|uniref:Immunity protein 52 domain-containing protein n=1 Tax=Mycolicibacterium sediminis TaxID=1286180 RepID=A0A7I7QJX0_9MYCO|nr:hypothetical protein [Mycolicibacterium sediminis]BBY26608.1 hypothetical protein MSEDJ_07040 [Mycolicibacterium sediminis]